MAFENFSKSNSYTILKNGNIETLEISNYIDIITPEIFENYWY